MHIGKSSLACLCSGVSAAKLLCNCAAAVSTHTGGREGSLSLSLFLSLSLSLSLALSFSLTDSIFSLLPRVMMSLLMSMERFVSGRRQGTSIGRDRTEQWLKWEGGRRATCRVNYSFARQKVEGVDYCRIPARLLTHAICTHVYYLCTCNIRSGW